MKILVTGGLGYIGSHTVVELLEKNYGVIVLDNLSNSSLDVKDGIQKITNKEIVFEKLDLKEKKKVHSFFDRHNDIDGIIHFAASKAIGESVNNPLLYYENNINTLVYLLQEVEKRKIPFIFSSSCTVYGQSEQMPIIETAEIKPPESPYGRTKQIGEAIIKELCAANKDIASIVLRYFNPIGAHSSSLIGETPNGVPQNLIPYITQTGIGIRDVLHVFGDDYPTKDGTCIRDYIHVVDLAKAHIFALQRLLNKKNKKNYEIFNIGTGEGQSIYEVINIFEQVSQKKLNYKVTSRRKGDITEAYADTTKANKVLGWKSKLTISQAIESAWEWELQNKNK